MTSLAVALDATGQAWTRRSGAFRRAADVRARTTETHPAQPSTNALFDHRDIEEAAAHATRAVALQPDDPAAHDTLGGVLAVQGKYAEAQAQFERALQLAPDDSTRERTLPNSTGS